MFGHITYSELVIYFGKDTALILLHCVERLAEIKNDIVQFDRNVRWATALEALNEVSYAG